MRLYFVAVVTGAMLAMCSATTASPPNGVIARTYEDGFPVIFKLVNELPSAPIRDELQLLTVISWEYDGSTNNGMPPPDVNQQMLTLERAIESQMVGGDLRHAYSRTGNNLKDLVYYAKDQTDFLSSFNDTLRDHPRYPIEIEFYEDEGWQDFQKLLRNVSKGG